jgi:hypothetical protein
MVSARSDRRLGVQRKDETMSVPALPAQTRCDGYDLIECGGIDGRGRLRLPPRSNATPEDIDALREYFETQAAPGDSFSSLELRCLLLGRRRWERGKMPDAEGRTPGGGAYW